MLLGVGLESGNQGLNLVQPRFQSTMGFFEQGMGFGGCLHLGFVTQFRSGRDRFAKDFRSLIQQFQSRVCHLGDIEGRGDGLDRRLGGLLGFLRRFRSRFRDRFCGGFWCFFGRSFFWCAFFSGGGFRGNNSFFLRGFFSHSLQNYKVFRSLPSFFCAL